MPDELTRILSTFADIGRKYRPSLALRDLPAADLMAGTRNGVRRIS